MNGVARTVLALGLGAGAACGGAGDGAAPAPVSVVPPTPPASPPPSPLEPVEVLSGVVVLAGAVETLRDPGWFRTTLDLRVSADAGTVAFDWFAPYDAGGDQAATFWTNVVEWRIERPDDGATLHSFDIEWPSHQQVGLRFRSDADADGDQPALLCTAAACTLTP